MPNWCYNVMTVSASPQLLLELADAFHNGRLFDSIIPVPEALKDERLHAYGGRDGVNNDNMRDEMQQTYGYKNMIEFCYDQWGTKSDVGFCEDGDHLIHKVNGDIQFSFKTAWSPPFGVYEALKTMGVYVVAEYIDEMHEYSGFWEDGVIRET